MTGPSAASAGFTMGEHLASQWFVDGAKERELLAASIDAALSAAVTAERERAARIAERHADLHANGDYGRGRANGAAHIARRIREVTG